MTTSAARARVPHNRLLAALPGDAYGRLAPHMEVSKLAPGRILYDFGEPIRHVYFPVDSIIHLRTTMEDGVTAEVGIIGHEGMLGTAVSLGAATVPNQAVVLVGNTAVRMRADAFKAEFDRGGPLQHLLLRYTQSLFVQVSQTAACNRVHTMDLRLCRWLLMVHDRLQDDDVPLTQESLSRTLGTRRPYVTTAAGQLQRLKLIRCTRGHIRILDRPGLEARACECHAVMRGESDRLSGIAA